MKTTEKELSIVKTQVSKVVTAAEGLVLKTNEDMPVAVEVLSRIKKVGLEIKNKKEGITKPLNEALKNARELFRPLEENWANAEKIVKDKMLSFNNQEEKRISDEAKKIAERVEAGKLKFETGVKKIEGLKNTEVVVESKSGEVQFRTVKKVVIENPALIPSQYWVIDEVSVRRDALAGIVIPGVKVVEEKTIAGYIK